MSEPGHIGSLPFEKWQAMKAGSVPDSLRATVEQIRHFGGDAEDPVAATVQRERQSRTALTGPAVSKDWSEQDYQRLRNEYLFAWNWTLAGCPIFTLTHGIAALLSTTRAPDVDFDHAPYPAFLIGVPDQFLPMVSTIPRTTRWLGVQSVSLMGGTGGAVLAIPDSETLSNAVAVGTGALSEAKLISSDEEWVRVMGISVRLASNVIQYVSQHRESACVRRTSSATASPVFEVRPPEDVVVDRAFRDLAAELVRARDFKGAKRALAHLVRGHWRNQAVGVGRSERRLTWVRPFRRGDSTLGTVIQKTMRLQDK